MSEYQLARLTMVERQIARRGIVDLAVLQAMRTVPREEFVPEPLRRQAYDDTALPIEAGQTISQPYIVALMASAAGIGPESNVLEIGTGSGYAAAILSCLARQVISVERIASLAKQAAARLKRLGYANVAVIAGDGTRGHRAKAPYDAILCAAGAPTIAKAWKDQLAVGGRLVMPLGPSGDQQLVTIVRIGNDEYTTTRLVAVRFVPLLGGVV